MFGEISNNWDLVRHVVVRDLFTLPDAEGRSNGLAKL
jgi:hypothetical protein